MIPIPEVLAVSPPVPSGPSQGQWTVAAWEALSEDGNLYEVIDGVLHMTTAPSFFHQWIVAALTEHLGIPLKQQQLGIYLFAPIGLIFAPTVALQPDFLVILTPNLPIIRGGRLRGRPT